MEKHGFILLCFYLKLKGNLVGSSYNEKLVYKAAKIAL